MSSALAVLDYSKHFFFYSLFNSVNNRCAIVCYLFILMTYMYLSPDVKPVGMGLGVWG